MLMCVVVVYSFSLVQYYILFIYHSLPHLILRIFETVELFSLWGCYEY